MHFLRWQLNHISVNLINDLMNFSEIRDRTSDLIKIYLGYRGYSVALALLQTMWQFGANS